MEFKILSKENITVISIEGSLDTNTSKDADNHFVKLLDEGKIKCVINLMV